MNTLYGPILIVEDVPNVLELLEVTLRFKGYAVLTARNGEEALEVIARQRPLLVITDILMPKLDGYAFVQKLRLNPETRAIPVVFLSATYVTPEDKEFALSLGAARFMEKPIDTEDFLLTVAELVTQQPFGMPEPLDMEKFYAGYRTRLENKCGTRTHIARAERAHTPPDDQSGLRRPLRNPRDATRSRRVYASQNPEDLKTINRLAMSNHKRCRWEPIDIILSERLMPVRNLRAGIKGTSGGLWGDRSCHGSGSRPSFCSVKCKGISPTIIFFRRRPA
jgi:CheY-like chemotaxis protein